MTRLERLATTRGLTVAEYLLAHPEYHLTARERYRYLPALLNEVDRVIEALRKHPPTNVYSAR